MKKYIYEIYEDDVLLMRGGAQEISNRYGLQVNKLSVYASCGANIRGRYRIKKVDEEKTYYKPNQPTPQSRKEIIDYFIFHLEKYGDVAGRAHEDPSIYLAELEEKGYKCIVTKFREIDTDDLVHSNNHRKTTGFEYTLTRITK